MRSIFESAKSILEKSEPSQNQLDALTKVMLSMKQAYSSINAVRSKLDTPTGAALLDIVSIIAGNTTLFNAFVSEFKKGLGIAEELDEAVNKQTNGVKWELASEADRRKGEYYVAYDKTTKKMIAYGLTLKGAEKIAKTDKNLGSASADFFADNIMKKANESVEVIELTIEEQAILNEDRLQNDIKSLKRIGWKLDKVIKHMVTKGSEYGVKMTSDLITMYYDDGGPKKKIAPVKVPKPKKVSWPKHPPKNKVNDPQHAEAFLGQVFDTGEVQDMTGTEAWQILTQAGYTEHATMWVIRNMGWEGDLRHGQGGTKIAKKTAPKWRQ